MRLLFTLFIFSVSFNSFSQQDLAARSDFMADGNGHPLYAKSEYKAEGTYFFPEKMGYGNVKVRNGKYYQGLKIQLNLLENQLVYQDNLGQMMVAAIPVEKVEFTLGEKKRVFRTGYPAVDAQSEQTFYEVLDSGKLSLLKLHKVNWMDKKEFNASIITRIFDIGNQLYVYSEKTGIIKLSKNREEFLSYFGDKAKKVSLHMDTNDLKLKKEADLLEIFKYYNTLN
jgi:hypothetical protein